MKLMTRNTWHFGSEVFLGRKCKQRLQGGISSLWNIKESLQKPRVEAWGYGGVVTGYHIKKNYSPSATQTALMGKLPLTVCWMKK